MTNTPSGLYTASRTSRNWTSCSDEAIARAVVGSSICSLASSVVNAPSVSSRNASDRCVSARSSTKNDAPANATSGSPKTRVYHSVSRARSDCGQTVTLSPATATRRSHRRRARCRRREHVPDATPRGDEGDLLAAVDLASQSAHVDVDQVRERIVVVVPNVRVDLGAGDDAAGVPHEVLEQRVLLRGEVDLALTTTGRVTPRIDDEVGDGELGLKDVAAAPDESAEPREELAEVEGLGEIVVGAGVEAGDLVVDGIARREHEDGHVDAFSSDLSADLETVHFGQDDVEHDRVVVVDSREKERFRPVRRVVDRVRRLAKPPGDRFAQLSVVLGKQNPHGRTLYGSVVKP